MVLMTLNLRFCDIWLTGAEEALRRIKQRRSSAEFDRANEEIGQVTRSITMVKPPYLRSLSVDNTDITSSPTAASPPISPSPCKYILMSPLCHVYKPICTFLGERSASRKQSNSQNYGANLHH